MSCCRKGRLAFALLMLGLWPCASPAQTETKYYMMIFAYDGRPKLARTAHSFATFIKVHDADTDKARVEAHTVSWMPATLTIRLLATPEKGVNLDLPQTVKLAQSQGAAVSAWGPVQIQPQLYERARAQIQRLNSGTVAYKAIDGRFRPEVATNCIHAISDIADGPMLDTGSAFGEPASRMVLQHLAPWTVSKETNGAVREKLGLSGNGITYLDDAPIKK
jgi:hypothetical protein